MNEGDIPQWKITSLVSCFFVIMVTPAVLITGVSCGYFNIISLLLFSDNVDHWYVYVVDILTSLVCCCFLIMLITGVSCGFLNIISLLLFSDNVDPWCKLWIS